MKYPGLLCALLLICTLRLNADSLSDEAYLEMINKKDSVDVAVEKGLKWLVSKQDLTYGFFQGKHRNTYTALACLALMAHGHFPGRSIYGVNLRKGVKYLVKQAIDNDGYLGKDGGRMYGHGICTLVLTEAYGMMEKEKDNREIKEALDKAIKLTLKSQVKGNSSHKGGWRYNPNSQDADLSVTVWQVLALRGAQNCRLDVPDASIHAALDYVRRCYSDRAKGFCYQAHSNSASPAMRVAGVVCMKALGADKDAKDKDKIEKSAEVMKNNKSVISGGHFFYRAYYWTTAANMIGGDYKKNVLKYIEQFMVKLQNQKGEFRNHSGYDGGVYATAFSLICLSVRNQYLPIYQE